MTRLRFKLSYPTTDPRHRTLFPIAPRKSFRAGNFLFSFFTPPPLPHPDCISAQSGLYFGNKGLLKQL
jgi:hypothetical protein